MPTYSAATQTLSRRRWKSTLASGVLAVILGVLILAWPGITIFAAAILFGSYMLVSGIAQVIHALSLHVSAGARILLFISGAVSLILAVLCFRDLLDAVLLLAIWIGVGFIFRGTATTVAAIGDSTLPGRGWEIFVGALSVIAGVVVLASPFASIATLAVVVGIWLVVIGVSEIASSFGIQRACKKLTSADEERTGKDVPVPA